LIKKYADLNDELFTEEGYKAFAEDLLERMTNPYLSDPIDRAARDPQRKLGFNDRIFGTMALCIEHGIEPENMSLGAISGIHYILNHATENDLPKEISYTNLKYLTDPQVVKVLGWLWDGQESQCGHQLRQYVLDAGVILQDKLDS
jgi:mannitol-1-phosphate/altronate dehydrogenase